MLSVALNVFELMMIELNARVELFAKIKYGGVV
jgi:hypothetical protein